MDTQAGDISNQSEDQFNKKLAAEGPVAKGDLAKAAKEYDAKSGAITGEMQSRLAGGRAKLASAEGALAGAGSPPQMQLVPPPQPQQTSPEQIWGSLAMILAGVGSLKSRQHMTTALNAAAGVMNAFHKGDMENYQANYNTWKASNDNAIKIAQYENKTYQDALRNVLAEGRLDVAASALDIREALARLQALQHSNEDPLMAQRLANEGVRGAIAVTKERDRQLDRITKATKDAQKQADQMYKGMDFKQAWASYSNSAEGQMLKQQNPNAFAAKFFELQRQKAPHTDQRGSGDPKDMKMAQAAYKAQYGQQLAFGKQAKSFEDFYKNDWKNFGEPAPEAGSDKPLQGPGYFMKRGAATPDQARADEGTKNKDEALPRHDLFEDGIVPHMPAGMSIAEARKQFGQGAHVILPDGKPGVVP